MTTDEAIALIPGGWRLRRLTDLRSGGGAWIAELSNNDGDMFVEEADTPAEAIRLAAEEAGLR